MYACFNDAWFRLTSSITVSLKSVPSKIAFSKLAWYKSACRRSAPYNFAPLKSAPTKLTPVKSAPLKSAPLKSAPPNEACLSTTPVRSQSDQSISNCDEIVIYVSNDLSVLEFSHWVIFFNVSWCSIPFKLENEVSDALQNANTTRIIPRITKDRLLIFINYW